MILDIVAYFFGPPCTVCNNITLSFCYRRVTHFDELQIYQSLFAKTLW